MPTKVMGQDVNETILAAKSNGLKNATHTALVDGKKKTFPYPYPSPTDWRDTALYFIMIDRFHNPEKPPKARWNSVYEYRQGGTFKGIQAQLPYLAELGVSAIWLSPVLKNPKPDEWKWSYAGYAPQNFLAVDERFGTEQDLIELIDEAHARGIYVILDIILDHAARVFDYEYKGSILEHVSDADVLYGESGKELSIRWLNGLGYSRPDWRNTVADYGQFDSGDGVYPEELRNPLFFRRRGAKVNDWPGEDGFVKGDTGSMRQLLVEYNADTEELQEVKDKFGTYPVLNILIRCYQYWMAKFDIDGFRVDSLKSIHPDMVKMFTSAIREYALSIGKQNFFVLGEAHDDSNCFADFTGRHSQGGNGLGIDATLDRPLYYKLPKIAKSQAGVEELRQLFLRRKEAEKETICSHGEAGQFFISFLDGHDCHERFNHPLTDPRQITLGLAVMLGLQGIPCLYYGTEQAFQGTSNYSDEPVLTSPESVREAMWGKPNAFDKKHPLYLETKKLLQLRHAHPALKYGRLYFRPISENGVDFGHSFGQGGLIAFSRVLGDSELLVVANTSVSQPFSGFVVIDTYVNRFFPTYAVLYSNQDKTGSGTPIVDTIHYWEEELLQKSRKDAKLYVELAPLEVQIIGVK